MIDGIFLSDAIVRLASMTRRRMKGFFGVAVAVGATDALTPPWAWAQTAVQPYGYSPHMMWGWGWYGMIFGPLVMILMLAVVIAALMVAVRWLGGPWQAAERLHRLPPGRAAIDILNERFARGDIDQDEYEAKRRLLSQG